METYTNHDEIKIIKRRNASPEAELMETCL